MANAADVVVNILANALGLKKGLADSKSSIDRFVSGATKALGGLAIAATIKHIVSEVLNLTSAIDDMNDNAIRLGITLQQFEQLSFAAKVSGSSVDALTRGFGFLEVSIDKAVEGSEKQVEAFTRLGLSAEYLKMLSPEKQFEQVAAALGRVSDQSAKVRLGKDIFGKGALELIPLFNSDIKDLKATFESLGVGITDSQQKAADAFDKSRDKFGTLTEGIKKQIAVTAAPAFTKLFDEITKNVSESKNLELNILKVASGIVTFVNVSVKGMSYLYNSVRLVIAGLKELTSLTQLAGAKIGSTLFDIMNEDQLSDVKNANVNPKSAVEDAKQDFLKTVEESRQVGKDFVSGFKTAIDPVSETLKKQISAMEKLQSGSTESKTQGFGEIIGADGRKLTVGTQSTAMPTPGPAPKPAEVNVTVSFDSSTGGLVAYVARSPEMQAQMDKQVEHYMNDVARQQAN